MLAAWFEVEASFVLLNDESSNLMRWIFSPNGGDVQEFRLLRCISLYCASSFALKSASSCALKSSSNHLDPMCRILLSASISESKSESEVFPGIIVRLIVVEWIPWCPFECLYLVDRCLWAPPFSWWYLQCSLPFSLSPLQTLLMVFFFCLMRQNFHCVIYI